MERLAAIDDRNKLTNALNFLASGFGWAATERSAMEAAITACNGRAHVYGMGLSNDRGQLTIAILFFYQGEVLVDGRIKKIMSTSSWFADKEVRGVESIRFLSSTVKFLKDNGYIVTNYTPNDIARVLYGRLGFVDQNSVRTRFYPWNIFSGRGGAHPTGEPGSPVLKIVDGFSYLGHLQRRSVKIGGRKIVLVYRVFVVKKFGLPLKAIDILWTDSDSMFRARFRSILLKLLAREMAVLANVYQYSPCPDGSSSWMILDPDNSLSYIPPLQSELTCI